MFIYWDGYEIDGSDTDFSIILPENVQIVELVDIFLQCPLLDRLKNPEITYYKGRLRKLLSIEGLKQKLLSGDYPPIEITINCLHPEELEESLRKEIYGISARREPKEKAYGKAEHPCTAPIKQEYYTRGEMTVVLWISNHTVTYEEDEMDGYVTNIELFQESDKEFPYVGLNVGPGFYYEYAIYLIDYLRDCFPSIATYGGLDCAGGWTDGCTYANSLYYFEQIELPVIYSVKNTIKRLCEYDLLCPVLQYYKREKNRWVYERRKEFFLCIESPSFLNEKGLDKLKKCSFDEYIDLVEQTLKTEKYNFDLVKKTAVTILLPKPENYKVCEASFKTIQKKFTECEVRENYLSGYFCFSRREEKLYAQFRIPYQIKPYFCTLLELMQTGLLEPMKAETYRRRHQPDES